MDHDEMQRRLKLKRRARQQPQRKTRKKVYKQRNTLPRLPYTPDDEPAPDIGFDIPPPPPPPIRRTKQRRRGTQALTEKEREEKATGFYACRACFCISYVGFGAYKAPSCLACGAKTVRTTRGAVEDQQERIVTR